MEGTKVQPTIHERRVHALLRLSGAAIAILALAMFGQRHRSLIEWRPIAKARSEAAQKQKLIMYDFSAAWCGPCRKMEGEVFSDPQIAGKINGRFVPVRVVDRRREDGRNAPDVDELQRRFNVHAYPTVVFADANLVSQMRILGYRDKQRFASQLPR